MIKVITRKRKFNPVTGSYVKVGEQKNSVQEVPGIQEERELWF